MARDAFSTPGKIPNLTMSEAQASHCSEYIAMELLARMPLGLLTKEAKTKVLEISWVPDFSGDSAFSVC